MRVFFFSAIVFSFLSLGTGLSGADQVAQVSVAGVTVYQDRAVITREAVVDLPFGVSSVTLPSLPHGLVNDSLQVSARAPGALSILDARVVERHGEAVEPERLQPLLEKQTALQEEIDQARIELNLLRQQQGFLTKVEEGVTRARPDAELPASGQWRDLLTFFRESLSEILPGIHEVETRKKRLREEHEAVTREINQTRHGTPSRSKEAVIRLETGAAMEGVRLILVHEIRNAGWSPVYNVRVDSADRAIRLEQGAMIRQRTGEDWENVHLTLSTARPALGGNPPRLGSWVVDVAAPPEPAPRGREAVAMRSVAASAELLGDRMEDAEQLAADVEQGLTAVSLRVPVAVSVPADGQPHRVAVGTVTMGGDFFHTVVPKLSPHAFLQARVTHPGEAPILPGRATIFLDGGMTGHSQLPRVEPGEEFDLSFGVDESILVERKLLRRFVDQRGIISRTTRTRFEYLTTVTNRRSAEQRVLVKDHLPVSRDERIRVNPVELSGGVADPENPGHLTWERTLAPGAQFAINLVFTVEHPDDLAITGLGSHWERE